MKSTPPAITVLGSANVDYVMSLDRLPAVGETVTNGSLLQTFGGKGANQAVAVARGGATCRFVGAVGEDPAGQAIAKNLANERIDTAGLYRMDTAATGSALVMVDATGDNYLAVAPGTNYQLTQDHVRAAAELISSSRMLLLQMEVPEAPLLMGVEIARRAGVEVMFNYAPARDRELGLRIASFCQALVVNEVEATQMSGIDVVCPDSAARAVEVLKRFGPRLVVITLGAQGAVYHADETRFVSPFKVRAVDSTAAGDTFCGALAVALVEHMSLPDAMRFASAAAACCVSRLGAQPSIPTRESIEQLLGSGDQQ